MDDQLEVQNDLETNLAASTASQSNQVFVISRVTINYVFIAIVAFFLGSMLTTISTNRSDETRRAENKELIDLAVTTALESQNIQGSDQIIAGTRISVSVDDDPSWGPEDAPVTIIEFSDFQCPFCGRFHQETYPQLREAYGDRIRFVYRDFPILQLHPNAAISAQAANCANEQEKYWEYHDLLLTNQNQSDRAALGNFAEQLDLDINAFDECIDSGRYEQEVNADVQEGSRYGVQGTPTFFINGRPIVGAQPFEVFSAIIDEELAAIAAASNP